MVDILIVDDSRVMREMIIACLRPVAGAAFTQAASGLHAIEWLSQLNFGLMVLDLTMPDIGGCEVLEFARGQDSLRWLPVIVVTAQGDAGAQAQAMKAGASRFFTKPFDPDAILTVVRALLAS